MGIRPIRYCDITGAEEGPGQEVEAHELHIDQMRVRIDLAAGEYQKLLALLRPYIDAGRIEASAPSPLTGLPSARAGRTGATRRAGTRLSAQEREQLVAWALDHNILVPRNRKFTHAVIEQWQRERIGVDADIEHGLPGGVDVEEINVDGVGRGGEQLAPGRPFELSS